MTMPHERTCALVMTGGFLIQLARDKTLPVKIRQRAVILARHFPTIEQLAQMAMASPNGFGCDLAMPNEDPDWIARCEHGPLTYGTHLKWPED